MDRITIKDSVFLLEDSYGVYQKWLESHRVTTSFWANRSCGLAAASNLLLALSTKPEGRLLFPKDRTISNAVRMLAELYDLVPPTPFGIIGKKPLLEGIKAYGMKRNIILKENIFRQKFFSPAFFAFIEDALINGVTPLFLKYNSREKELDYLWVAITGIDYKEKKIIVSNWGEKKSYPFKDFQDFSLHKSLWTMEV